MKLNVNYDKPFLNKVKIELKSGKTDDRHCELRAETFNRARRYRRAGKGCVCFENAPGGQIQKRNGENAQRFCSERKNRGREKASSIYR